MINFEIAELYRRNNNLVNLIGFILYTEKDSNIVKVINDDDYWNGFDASSGDKWAIFSIRAKKGNYGDSDDIYSPKHLTKKTDSEIRFRIIPIWNEPKSNLDLISEFELNDSKNFPILLLVSSQEETMYKTYIKLDDTTLDTARNSIKHSIETITKIVNISADESNSIFQKVKRKILIDKAWSKFKIGIKYTQWIKDFIG